MGLEKVNDNNAAEADNQRLSESSFEPIAIVSMAFRLPADSRDEQDFWQGLKEGRDFVSEIPAERWAVDELQHTKRAEPGRSVSFAAGVLSDIDKFDADFFCISPREAAMVDPQHRLLLELSWEAMENAGYVPSSLAGSDCAVYVGISGLDYATRKLDDSSVISAHTMTGNTLSIAANRLSYFYDLKGPSLAVDTACSSSLVALHHACRALQTGESSMALVGGVNMLLHPYPFIGFTKASMLSQTGRCKVFDASADGYVRSEGGAVFLLKPLKAALADGDDVQAVIRSSGVNADGGQKTGITIPSAEGQADLMRSVVRLSGLNTNDIDFIEAHGTGTLVGDPIEAHAIGTVYGEGRVAPLPVGSVKANIGHLEPASGLAGLVKTVLALKNRALPPALHLKKPNPYIDFSKLNLELIREYKPLKAKRGKPLTAGVNSFGFGGANAHLIMEEYRSKKEGKVTSREKLTKEDALPPLFLSANSDEALKAMATDYHAFLKGKPAQAYYDIAFSVVHHRERMEKRCTFKASTVSALRKLLNVFAEGDFPKEVVLEDALPNATDVAFVYSGNGAQWHGMCQSLITESSRFAEILAEVDAVLKPMAGFAVVDELLADEEASRLDDTAVAQPVLFAIQVAVTQLLKEEGVSPKVVMGHSVGEVAAAWAAGVFDLPQAAYLICARSAAQALTKGTGRMAAVAMSEADIQAILAEHDEALDVVVAGVNSPQNVTLSGSLADLEVVHERVKAQRKFFKLLDLDYAFHSQYMDCIQSVLAESLTSLKPKAASDAIFVSAVTGDVVKGEALGADYWWKNVRQPVQFSEAMHAALQQQCDIFIEVGPHAILQRYMDERIKADEVDARVLPTLLNDAHHGMAQIEETALRTHTLLDGESRNSYFSEAGRRVRLPNYPWQRERHWVEKTSEDFAILERRRQHPVLGWQINSVDMVWENTVDSAVLPWLADHQVAGAIVFPGAAYVEMALAAAREWLGGEQFAIEELDITSPIVFDGEHARTLRFNLNQRDGSFYILSRQRLSKDDFSLHAAGRIMAVSKQRAARIEALPETAKSIDQKTHYELTESLGLQYGERFQGLHVSRISDNRLEADIVLPKKVAADDGYIVHPAILDLCFQSLIDFFADHIKTGAALAFLPIKVGQFYYYNQTKPIQFRAHLKRFSLRSALADFELLDEQGELVAIAADCRFKAMPMASQKEATVEQWETVPWLAPHELDAVENRFPSTRELIASLHADLPSDKAPRQFWFKEILPLLEALTVAYVFEAFQKVAGQGQHAFNELLRDKPSPFLRWLMHVLTKQGLLVKDGKEWRLVIDSDVPESDEIWQYLQSYVPECSSQLLLMGRIGLRLPAVISGELKEQQFLDDLNQSISAAALYDTDPAYTGVLAAIEYFVKSLATHIPEGRRLRVLEIAPSASQFPRRLVHQFDEDKLDYVIAVAEDEAVQHLQSDYQDFANVAVTTFNLNDGKVDLEPSSTKIFDVVIVRHTLHQFIHPHAALKQAAQCLTKGGALLVAERYADASADLLGGIDNNWWYVEDGVDKQAEEVASPLLPPESWMQALTEEGFNDVEHFTETAAFDLAQGAYLVLAKNPDEPVIETPELKEKTWVFLVDDVSVALAKSLKARFESRLQHVIIQATAWEPDNQADHVVSLLGWNTEAMGAVAIVNRTLQMIQGMDATKAPAIWVVTRGGALVAEHPAATHVNPAQTALWGFSRVVMNEYAALNYQLIDLVSDLDAEAAIDQIENELLQPDGSNEVILTNQGRYRLLMQSRAEHHDVEEGSDGRYYLDFHTAGQLRNLRWLPAVERPLQDNEVEVKTKAAGLNFRDIMYLMGLLPDEAVEKGFAGASLGLEFSGVVTRVGARVHHYRAGDAVMGFGSSCFASHVVTTADAISPMPEDWTFEAAATVPTTFFTAYYSLKSLAQLQAGERVLIHGAAGGVGIAALQLARHLGAEIFATAGSDEKRDLVRLLGADHVFDSRSLDFAEDVLAATNGEGVDVILNSLAGEAIRRNLSILKPFGRFLELGKRDFFENTPVGLRPFKDNISYFGIDADQLLVSRPDLAVRLFHEVMALFHEGAFTPLPHRVFDVERVVDAFRTMQQARHIGKVVVSLDEAKPVLQHQVNQPKPVELDENSTWLVTGGLTGFGLASAKWLVARGVKHLVLLSRRGMKTPDAEAIVAEFETAGVDVLVLACDMTDAALLGKAIKRVKKEMPPLKGVLHAAMVIDDQLMANLDEASVAAVMQPKLSGAWHLHTLTQKLPLDYFVLYSSITTYIGNPGQANYVAANAGLEGLAELRRSQGLPAQCIAWGPIADAGYLTRNEDVKDSLEKRMGKAPIDAHDALQQLDVILRQPNYLAAVANFDWNVLSRVLPSASATRFDHLNRTVSATSGLDESVDLQALVAGKDREEVEQLVTEMIVREVSAILYISVEKIHPRRPLHDLGMDSLMAVELALGLERRFGIQLPVMMLNDSPSVEKVTVLIVDKVFGIDNAITHNTEGLVIDGMAMAMQHGEKVTAQEVERVTQQLAAQESGSRE